MFVKMVSCAVLAIPLLAPAQPRSETAWRTANLLTPRESQSAVVLTSSSLLITGGDSAGSSLFGDPTNTTEIYDSKSNTWRFVGAMSTPRVGQIAVRLVNGDVLVAGGEDSYASPLRTAEVFSARFDAWTAVASMPKPAAEQAAVVLRNGEVLVTGGVVAGRVSNQALLYNDRTNAWWFAAPMNHARAAHESLLLPDGNVLVAGGTTPYAELYLPGPNRWKAAGRAGERLFPAAVRVGRSHVLVAGGRVIQGGCLASAVVYTGKANWISAPPMDSPRCAPLSTSLPNGRAIVGGGFDTSTWSGMQEFNPRTTRWLPFPSLPGPRAAGTLSYLDGSIIAAGGTVEGSQIATSVARRIAG